MLDFSGRISIFPPKGPEYIRLVPRPYCTGAVRKTRHEWSLGRTIRFYHLCCKHCVYIARVDWCGFGAFYCVLLNWKRMFSLRVLEHLNPWMILFVRNMKVWIFDVFYIWIAMHVLSVNVLAANLYEHLFRVFNYVKNLMKTNMY